MYIFGNCKVYLDSPYIEISPNSLYVFRVCKTFNVCFFVVLTSLLIFFVVSFTKIFSHVIIYVLSVDNSLCFKENLHIYIPIYRYIQNTKITECCVLILSGLIGELGMVY